MKVRRYVRVSGLALVAFAVVGLVACGRGDSGDVWTDESGLLKYVPADSPYVFAQGEATPDEVMDKLGPWLESLATAYVQTFRTALQGQEGTAFNGEQLRMVNEMLTIAGELMTAEGLADAGITRESKVLIYGSGLLPVMRMTLTDGAKLEAAIARIESTAGVTSTEGTIGGQSYRYWGDDNARLVMAIVDSEVVFTATPTNLADQHLGLVLGDDLPANNIAASGKLDAIAEKYGFGSYWVGFVDVPQIAATFLDDPTAGIDAELLALAEYDHSMISPVCKTEIAGLAAVAPRLVVGYTALDAEQMAMNMVLELREDIAAGLQTIPAPVPGNGTFRADIMTVGMGFDVQAALDFVEARMDAIEADPFRCEYFAQLSAMIPTGRQMLMSQQMPPDVYAFKGMVIGLDAIEGLEQLANGGMPTEISARVLVASDNAPNLVAMGSMFSPELGAMQPNGNPVRVNVPIPLPIPLEVWAALTPTTVGIALGSDGDARLRELLAAPTSDLRPFMSWDVDFQSYYQLIGDVVAIAATMDPTVASEMTASATELMSLLTSGPFDREIYAVHFTANGVEMPTTVTFTD